MGEVHSLPNPEDTEREASDWFARMNADDVSADDRARFETWLHAYSCNEKAYAELTATWKELVRSGPLVRAVHFGQVMNAASARSVRSRHWLAGAVAATLGALPTRDAKPPYEGERTVSYPEKAVSKAYPVSPSA